MAAATSEAASDSKVRVKNIVDKNEGRREVPLSFFLFLLSYQSPLRGLKYSKGGRLSCKKKWFIDKT